IPVAGEVNISLYDLNGRLLRSLLQSYREAGSHVLRLQATANMPSGVYLLRLNVDGKMTAGNKVLLLK
ncbi:MAG: T9SS type A sorting domain-containing protein, partial [Candidatus Marinimicrobia bacterium]|nr:T9SS type A sorting domain-containing protein [Candidatus Neomarinimicrobiota bacterium]